MAEAAELRVMLEDARAFVHDMLKYTEAAWDWKFLKFKSIKDHDFEAAKKVFYAIAGDIDIIRDLLDSNDFSSVPFKNAAKGVEKKALRFLKSFGRFAGTNKCPRELKAFFRDYSPAFKMVVPLARFLSEGKYVLKKRKVRLRFIVKELEPWFSNLPLKIEGGKYVRTNVSVRIEGDPVVYADPLHLRRAIFNVLNDAIVHSKGELVRVSIRAKKNVVFSTTNVGRKVERRVLRLIGKVPYTTRDIRLTHGYGKVAAAGIVEAHGGKFRPWNSPQGFRISLSIPRGQRKRRVA